MAPEKTIRTPQARPLVLAAGRIVDPATGHDAVGSLLIDDGRIAGLGAPGEPVPAEADLIDCAGKVVAPGLVDMRVFIGEPGAEHRETLSSVSMAAAAGGVTSLVVMPDTDPVIDDMALLDFMLRRARDESDVNIHAAAALTNGLNGRELTEFGLLRDAGAIAFDNGRRSVENAQVMRRALTYAGDFDALVCHHTEDSDLVGHGVMNEGETASRLGLAGIPVEAETVVLDRDVRLAALTGGRFHAAQITAAPSVEILRRAKNDGLAVSAAVSINHITLNEYDIGPYRTFFKLSPPLRAEEDRVALTEALADGSIDVIVSSHDPQDVEMKRHPFAEAADGAIGLETLLAAGLRRVHDESLGLSRLLYCLSTGPARLLRLDAGSLEIGRPADVIVFDPDEPWIVDPDRLRSRSKNTPFDEARMTGRVHQTLVAGRRVYDYGV